MTQKKIAIIGVAQDLGASRRGVDMGPSAIRLAKLKSRLTDLGFEVKDYGNILCHDFEQHVPTHMMDKKPNLRFLPYIVDTCIHLRDLVQEVIKENYFPLVLGGDHSITIGTLAGLKNLNEGKTGLIWVDAHGDFNTPETTPSGNIHGMPFAVATGRGTKELLEIGPSPTVLESNSVLFGARDLDKKEAELLKSSDVHVITMSSIDKLGIHECSRQAIETATKGVEHLHISFDIDAIDPSIAKGTGTPVIGGLSYREAHTFLEMVAETKKLTSLDILEVNPILDDSNKTAELAVSLILSALGKKIL